MSTRKVTYVTLLADESIHPRYERALDAVAAEFGQHYPMYIGEREVHAAQEFEDRSPIDTGLVLGYFQKGSAPHVRQAIHEANRGFSTWARRDWRERVAIMRRTADLLSERLYRLAALITYEVGKNRFEAIAEVGEALDTIRYYADITEQNEGYARAMAAGAPGERTRSVLRPYGAWVVISPFNFPVMLASGMTQGALITGNTVVLKPTSEAPLAALQFYKVLRDAGVPAGVINYVTGPGASVEEAVTANLEVAGVAFTGSKDVGTRLYKAFVSQQPYPKPFIAEMGSKNPTIVTSRADLDKAVEGVVRAAFGYGGQKCSATSRVYVEQAVFDSFLQKLQARTRELRVGDPRERQVFIGPVINDRAYRDYQGYVEQIQRDGGHLVSGGHVLREGKFERGYYVAPTVATSLPAQHPLFRQELFVPLVLVDQYSTLEEAIGKANDTEFGLTAGIFSEDAREIERFFEGIEFGVVYANRKGGATTGAWPGAQAFGGWKASGCTGKGVGGSYYLLQFLREQAQTIVEEA